jgi:trypsin
VSPRTGRPSVTSGAGPRVVGLLGAGLALAVASAPAAGASSPPGARASVPVAAPSSPGARATPRIVGGTKTMIRSAPYQAHLRIRLDGRPWGDAAGSPLTTCGGVVVSRTVVVTAAHCVIHRQKKVPGRAFVVETGFSKYATGPRQGGAPAPFDGDTLQQRRVTAVRVHPGYPNPAARLVSRDERVDDVATLTLAEPLKIDANTATIPLAALGGSPTSGPARATGFGTQAEGADADGRLWSLGMGLADPGDATYGPGTTSALYVVALSPQGSTCHGDSGGPLVQNGQLIGISSSVDGCGPGRAAFFTSVGAPEVRQFIVGDDAPPLAPRGGNDVRLSGFAQAGRELNCFPGTWSNAPAVAVSFLDTRNGQLLQQGPSTTYAVSDGDVGRTIACRASATNVGGVGLTPYSGATPPIVARPAPPAPRPAGGPAPAALRVRIAAGTTRVRRRGRVAYVVAVDNVGGTPASRVRTCATIGSRFTVVSRRGGTLRRGRLCWTTSTLKRRTLKRFVLRAKSNARRGRTTAVTVKASAADVRTDRASGRLTVRR